jgi:hypothetical protein
MWLECGFSCVFSERLQEEIRLQQEELKRVRDAAAREKEQIQRELAEQKQRERQRAEAMIQHPQQRPPVSPPNSSGYGVFASGNAQTNPPRPIQWPGAAPPAPRSTGGGGGQHGFSVAPTDEALPTPVPLPVDFQSMPALPVRPAAVSTQLPALPPQPLTGPDAALSPRSWEAKELSRREKKEAKKLRKKEEEERKREKKKEKREKKSSKAAKKSGGGGGGGGSSNAKISAMASLSMPHTPAQPATMPVQHQHQPPAAHVAPTPPKSAGHSDSATQNNVSLASAASTLETPKERANFFEMSKSKDIQLNDDEALKAGGGKKRNLFKKSNKGSKTEAISRTQSGLKLDSKPYLSIWYGSTPQFLLRRRSVGGE